MLLNSLEKTIGRYRPLIHADVFPEMVKFGFVGIQFPRKAPRHAGVVGGPLLGGEGARCPS